MSLVSARKALQTEPDLEVASAGRLYVRVPLGERAHRVRVTRRDGWWCVTGVIADLASISSPLTVRELLLRLLSANQTTELVRLGRDSGQLVAISELPVEGTPITEVVVAVRRVARVADRWEVVWAGDDLH